MLMIVQKDCTTVTTSTSLPDNTWDYQGSLLDLRSSYTALKPKDWAEVDRLSLNTDTQTLFITLTDGKRYKLPYYGNDRVTLAVSFKNAVKFMLEQMGLEGVDNE